MSIISLVPVIYGKGAQAGMEPGQYLGNISALGTDLYHRGADGIMVVMAPECNDMEKEAFILACQDLIRETGVPVYLAGNVKRFEDTKKYLYTGARYVILDSENNLEMEVSKEAISRFGERIIVSDYQGNIPYAGELAKNGFTPITLNVEEQIQLVKAEMMCDYFGMKELLAHAGNSMNLLAPEISWEELEKNESGLVPVIVQDIVSKDVLMMAYMDENAYNETVSRGRMCYYSRSRQERWLKGDTSGHFQYVKRIFADCDKDTLLANVLQVGAACHTGERSCFFQKVMEKETGIPEEDDDVLQQVYDTILDRKSHPKEGSYTNYLFDKGIDKILKKCGEEATEIVIAAKNPNAEEIKYEISDFLYHMMVLMVERGVSWEDILGELKKRH